MPESQTESWFNPAISFPMTSVSMNPLLSRLLSGELIWSATSCLHLWLEKTGNTAQRVRTVRSEMSEMFQFPGKLSGLPHSPPRKNSRISGCVFGWLTKLFSRQWRGQGAHIKAYLLKYCYITCLFCFCKHFATFVLYVDRLLSFAVEWCTAANPCICHFSYVPACSLRNAVSAAKKAQDSHTEKFWDGIPAGDRETHTEKLLRLSKS